MKTNIIFALMVMVLPATTLAAEPELTLNEGPNISVRLQTVRVAIEENRGQISEDVTTMDQNEIQELAAELQAIRSDKSSTVAQKAYALILNNQLNRYLEIGVDKPETKKTEQKADVEADMDALTQTSL